jgi:hypothetical protein
LSFGGADVVGGFLLPVASGKFIANADCEGPSPKTELEAKLMASQLTQTKNLTHSL